MGFFEKLFQKAAEMPAAELEKPNFKAAVIQRLIERGRPEIVADIESGKINLEVEANKMVEMGKLAETAKEMQGDKFDSTDHLIVRAQKTADELIDEYDRRA